MLYTKDRLFPADRQRQKPRRPQVSLCFAQSLDGCLTVQRGQPTQLSGAEASRLTHELRAAHDAILVGVGTVIADNPQLTVRLVEGRNPQPVILDSRLRTPLQASLLQRAAQPVWIATTPAADPERRTALERLGAQLLVLPPDGEGRVSLPALLAALAEARVRSLMVEGGAQVITSFLAQKLVDRVSITVSPVILGGLPAVEPCLAGPSRLQEIKIERLGEDVVISGRLR